MKKVVFIAAILAVGQANAFVSPNLNVAFLETVKVRCDAFPFHLLSNIHSDDGRITVVVSCGTSSELRTIICNKIKGGDGETYYSCD
ncbi:hypothetical protein FJM67_16870 [Maribrevibacterium harenarium]|uniref:Uncharacterized protein n=1 Tax=Maribrevibacterium harenarium TaxID=2589817 RepID=A0A501WBK1_9GAMM|nr:hypothetical protein [Maribrevibacterium harenarium]TPE44581.1 hypothetical protein FJM67_16870 [Maribrevibacterium harenarium]